MQCNKCVGNLVHKGQANICFDLLEGMVALRDCELACVYVQRAGCITQQHMNMLKCMRASLMCICVQRGKEIEEKASAFFEISIWVKNNFVFVLN
jgi:hypothetical protein